MTLSSLLDWITNKSTPPSPLRAIQTLPRYVVLSKSVPPEKIEEIKILHEAAGRPGRATPRRKQADAFPRTACSGPHICSAAILSISLASTILGFYSYLDREQGRGYFGVEEKYDHLLAGSPVEIIVPQDPYLITKPPIIPPGVSLVLTIDREIQAMAEEMVG